MSLHDFSRRRPWWEGQRIKAAAALGALLAGVLLVGFLLGRANAEATVRAGTSATTGGIGWVACQPLPPREVEIRVTIVPNERRRDVATCRYDPASAGGAARSTRRRGT